MEDYKDFIHTGPGTLAGRYLRTFWQPVYVADELKPGWAKPITVMGEDFTLYRGESGKPYLVAQRCAHRGTQLSLGWVEGDRIRCLYHGWKYDGSGQCVEQPGEGRASFAGRVKIAGYPTEEYLGHIFAYLGEGNPPPLPRYPDLENGVIEAGRYTRACNYFNNVENGVDLFHVAWAHRDAHMEHSLDYEAGGFFIRESEWGVTANVRLRDGKVRTNQLGMPNLLHFRSQPVIAGGDWTDVMGWRVPVTDEYHQSFNVRVMHVAGKEADRLRERIQREPLKNPGRALELARAALRGELRIRDLKEESQGILVNVQDDATQTGQGIFADRERELLGQTDEGVILLRRIWERELKALAEGRPLKQWRRPPTLMAASGA